MKALAGGETVCHISLLLRWDNSLMGQKGSATVRDIPVPKLEDNEVLIKIECAAQVGLCPSAYRSFGC